MQEVNFQLNNGNIIQFEVYKEINKLTPNQYSKDTITQTKQQRPELSTVTLTQHASKIQGT